MARAVYCVGITLCIIVLQLQTVIVQQGREPHELRISVETAPEPIVHVPIDDDESRT